MPSENEETARIFTSQEHRGVRNEEIDSINAVGLFVVFRKICIRAGDTE
jgi:hypothetical protein